MANNNNDSYVSTFNPQILGAGLTLPSGFNDSREPGELSRLFDVNSNVIYNKLSPKTGYTGLFKFGPRQPFITVNPNEGTKGVNGLKKYDSTSFPFASSIQDVERITKWSLTGDGVVFLGKQLLLQSQNPFNETKLYNPAMPILSVVSKASFGLLPTPTRHIDTSGGIVGMFTSFLGFGNLTDYAPSGTVGKGAVSETAKRVSNPYKGLLRGATASDAYTSLQHRWEASSNSFSLGASIKNYFKSAFNKIFGGIIPIGQPSSVLYRADEKTYGLMLSNNTNFINYLSNGEEIKGVFQRWWSGKEISNQRTPNKYTRNAPFVKGGINIFSSGTINNKQIGIDDFNSQDNKGSRYTMYIGRNKIITSGDPDTYKYSDQLVNYAYYTGDIKTNVIANYFENGTKLPPLNNKKTLFGESVPETNKYFGYDVGYKKTKDEFGNVKYSDNVGNEIIRKENKEIDSLERSDLLSEYAVYTKSDFKDSNKQNTKFTNKTDDAVKSVQSTLNKVIENIKTAGYTYNKEKTYNQFTDVDNIGFNAITYKTKNPFDTKGPNNYNGGYMTNFSNSRKQLIDAAEGKGFAGSGNPDKINLLNVASIVNGNLVDTNGNVYDSAQDDQIAFFFKDIVNEKYIPFRATVKGLSESLTAEWNDVSYMGRADKLYSYKGFTRSISFNFSVNINSIKELAPTWTRINYFCGMVKPANYTGNNNYPAFSRFIIPPMIEFTIGDLYKNQSGVITSIGLSIPEDAIWETLIEDGANNINSNDNWNYLNGAIELPDSKGKYAQFPNSADISVSINVFEKEKPIMGGSHFGDNKRDVNYKNLVTSGKFSENLLASNVK
jgi:hypothetical protein